MRDATIRLQELDGTWQTLGADRAQGITAEGLSLTANTYGPDTATFELHRDPAASWPDLSAFTPVEIEIGNQLAWSGRIAETQVQDGATRQLSVRCEGWQYHLDDDQIARTWVNRNLGEWRDLRDIVAVGNDWVHDGTVETGDGNIWMGWKAGTTPKTNQLLAIVLDLGAQANYTGWTMYLSGKAHQESLAYPLTGTHQGGYLMTTGTITATTPLNLNTPPYWISGTAYTANEIVILSSSVPKGYQANKTIPAGSRATSPDQNPTDWDELYGPLWGTIGSAVTDTSLSNLAALSGSSFASTYSATFGFNNGTASYGAWMTGSGSTVKAVKDVGSRIAGTAARSRYAVLVLQWRGPNLTSPLTNAYGWNLTGIATFGSDTYSAKYGAGINAIGDIIDGQVSTLKASDAIADAITEGAPRLGQQITATTTALQDFKSDGYKTPREVIEAANAYHGWIARVGGAANAAANTYADLIYKAAPTQPRFELGAWSGYDFTDQAATTTDDIYTRVIVEATGPDGNLLRVARTAAQLANAAGNTSSTLTSAQRDTLLVRPVPTDTALAATSASAKGGASVGATGTFRAGVTYRITGRVSCNGSVATVTIGSGGTVSAQLLSGQSGATLTTTGNAFQLTGTSGFLTAPLEFNANWTPQTDQTWDGASGFVSVSSSGSGGSDSSGLDQLTLTAYGTNLAERRGLRRTYILSAPGTQTTATLNSIGDAWLYQRLRAQFRGSVSATGTAAIRQVTTGDPVHPSRLLLEAGELVRLTDRLDPDTGQLGRDARITAVTYDHDGQRITLELDNRRDNLQTFLNRLAVV